MKSEMTLDKEAEKKILTEPGDNLKIICLGDSAVGKSKLVERFLMDGYKPQQLSTYALTLFKYETKLNGQKINIDFWDTAGQERFSSLHASYYHQASACILVFDATRKITYKNLANWYKELRHYRPNIPCLLAVNKIDEDIGVTQKSFAFGKKHSLPFYYVSAANGTNVVKLFRDSIKAALSYKQNTTDYMDHVLQELDNFDKLGVRDSDSDLSEDENADGDNGISQDRATRSKGSNSYSNSNTTT
ncbi:rab-like protein 2A [Styela clava]|uniref:rab-like protein 2A n=1 Tax=Styela clava TaxID=7725 RepID=UPI001939CFEB|nr:rab-like protein 2A [Styela clava]